jgi:hypothetical protein
MYDGCSYEWPFAKTVKGYGRLTFHGKHRFAHIVSFMIGNNLSIDPRSDGGLKQFVRHLCNKGHLGCFNFECLELGSRKDDHQDQIEAGTWSHGETHGGAVLSSHEVDEIRMLSETIENKQLALMFHVSRAHIGRILRFEARRNG